jgi:transcriptional regulator with XRE-family HTH domain
VDDLRAALGNRVQKLREDRRLSQEALAERADLHPTYISQLERGLRNPSLNVLGRLGKALGASLPELVSHLADHVRPSPRRQKRGRPRALKRRTT